MTVKRIARIAPLCLPLLVGCSDLDDLKDKVEGYTNPTVIEGLVLGVAEPDFDFDLSKTDFNKGAAGVVFLADAASADEIESAPIDGADVSILSETTGKLAMNEDGDGKYSITGDDGFEYTVGEDLDLNVDVGDQSSSASVTAPAAADVTIDEAHTAGEAITVDLTGQSFSSVLVAVFDAGSGELTFSNQPEGIKEIYDFTHGGAESLVVDIPGSAFSAESVYAVGVAGLKNAGEDDFGDANTLLSTYMAGKMKFFPVSTITLPD